MPWVTLALWGGFATFVWTGVRQLKDDRVPTTWRVALPFQATFDSWKELLDSIAFGISSLCSLTLLASFTSQPCSSWQLLHPLNFGLYTFCLCLSWNPSVCCICPKSGHRSMLVDPFNQCNPRAVKALPPFSCLYHHCLCFHWPKTISWYLLVFCYQGWLHLTLVHRIESKIFKTDYASPQGPS